MIIRLGCREGPLQYRRLPTSSSSTPQGTHGASIAPLSDVVSDNSSRVWIRFNAHLRPAGDQAPQIARERLSLYALDPYSGITPAV